MIEHHIITIEVSIDDAVAQGDELDQCYEYLAGQLISPMTEWTLEPWGKFGLEGVKMTLVPRPNRRLIGERFQKYLDKRSGAKDAPDDGPDRDDDGPGFSIRAATERNPDAACSSMHRIHGWRRRWRSAI